MTAKLFASGCGLSIAYIADYITWTAVLPKLTLDIANYVCED